MNYENPTFPEPPKSLWERFNPRHIALADRVAQQSRQKNDLGGLMANAQMGYTPDDQEKMELEGRLQELTTQFVEQTKDLDDSAYQQAASQFMEQVGAPAPQRQQAELNNPNAMQSGFALLAAVLDPKHAADTVAQPLMYQLGDQQKRQGQADVQYADQTRQRNEQIGAAETRMNVEERKLGKQQQSQDRQAGMTRQLMSDVQKSLDKLDQRSQVAINQAFTAYNSANTADEKELAGRRLQTVLSKTMPELAPTDEEIGMAAENLRVQGSRYANQEWEASLKNELNAFGEVDESRATELESQRIAVAKRYGIDPANLRSVPTAKTVAAQKMALAQEQFSFLTRKTSQDFKLKWANYQIAKQRAQTYAAAVANGYVLGTERNMISSGHLQMRGLEMSAKEIAKSSKTELQTILNEINTLSRQSPSDEVNKKLDRKRAEMQQLVEPIAAELGISPTEMIKDPVGTMQKILSAMDEDEQNREAEARQEAPVNPLAGGITPTGTKPTQRPAQGPKNPKYRKPQGLKLPPGAKLIKP